MELWHLKPGPDGLVRITRRQFGAGVAERIVVEAARAEELVLERWREEHRRVLGYAPSW